MFTSGTTGTPKGIINTTNTKLSALRAMVRELQHEPDDTWLVVPPMAHNAGWLYSLLPAIVSGAAAIFQGRFDAQVTLDLIDQHAVRAVFLTPTHATDVLACLDAGRATPTSLRLVVIGGAATSVQMKTQMRERLDAEVISMYGCTENQGVTFVRPGDRPEDVDDTVGRVCPGAEVAILADDRSTRLGPVTTGLVATRGPGTFVGYFDDQTLTDAAFNVEDWFFPGDLGQLDESGALRLMGRQKELIIRDGLNIVPDDRRQCWRGTRASRLWQR
jgi:acyl-CoA synthetase (AMP-forming)/AMP-acid ligase II